MLKPEFTGQFKKDYKLAIKRGIDPKKLEDVNHCYVARRRCHKHIGIINL